MIQHLIGKVTLEGTDYSNADMNDDGRLSIVDAIKLKNLLLQ